MPYHYFMAESLINQNCELIVAHPTSKKGVCRKSGIFVERICLINRIFK